MVILGIEASGLVASAAVWEDGVLRAEYTINNKLTHSQTLLPMIEAMLSLSETALDCVDAIAVSEGPGSFTGLRIGAATAKGLALAKDIPVIGISSLRALSENEADSGMLVVPLMDARRGQVYCGAWQDGKEIISERAVPIEELIGTLRQALPDGSAGEKTAPAVLFLGDGVPVHKETILKTADFPCRFASAGNARQRAASVAELGAADYAAWLSENGFSAEEAKALGADRLSGLGKFSGSVMNSDEFVPKYLRKPQAEREKEAGLLEDPGMRSLRKIARGAC
ncbi:MAG: tRNA (adenosine(37)-N6)-threonylcarbamoyltransferase complex dimerization subunit type 1 TsaB [Eubacteriales bacterium]|nr:tRNA (adenosine(37)-N6)-threonylcarbamoyltransferase complex dimerization subunit type 1 TsaB [Eubacteriales bacterium]